MFQVGSILFEQDQQVRVVAYHMFRYSRVRLTAIEAVNIRVTAHRKVFSHRILLVAFYIIIKIEFGRARWNDITVVGEHKVADFIDRHK